MRNICWGDIDLDNNILTVRIKIAKASREDTIPLHSEVKNALIAIKSDHPEPISKVFATMPSIETFHKDITRGRKLWINESKNAKQRKEREKSDFLKAIDSSGRCIDLHAMRTTLGTRLALNGVIPQVAQKIMRHSDYRTTLKHYTVIGIETSLNAIAKIPGIGDNSKSENLHVKVG